VSETRDAPSKDDPTRRLFYAESPFERIVNVHWKPPDTGGEPPPRFDCQGPCASGYFEHGLFFSQYFRIWIGELRGIDPGSNTENRGQFGAALDPTSCCPATAQGFDPAGGINYDPKYTIPGNCAEHITVTVKWAAIVAGANDYYIGAWVYRDRGYWNPFPHLTDPRHNPDIPPDQQPPNHPMFSAYMNTGGDGEFVVLDFDYVVPGDETVQPEPWIGSIIVGITGVPADPIAPPVLPFSATEVIATSGEPTLPRDEGDAPHYGFPGDAPTDGGIWVEIDHTCPDTATASTPFVPQPRKSRRPV
jgi:hypothetical protein